MGAIDIGSAAINRGQSWASAGYTLINKNNASNGAGLIKTIQIFCGSNLANCIVGTFYVVSGNTLKCRASAALGTVTSGSTRTFNSPADFAAITVVTGDYIGIYSTSGSIDRDTGTGAGLWNVSGQSIDPGDEAGYTFESSDTLSLYGTGVTASRGWMSK